MILVIYFLNNDEITIDISNDKNKYLFFICYKAKRVLGNQENHKELLSKMYEFFNAEIDNRIITDIIFNDYKIF